MPKPNNNRAFEHIKERFFLFAGVVALLATLATGVLWLSQKADRSKVDQKIEKRIEWYGCGYD